MRVDFEFKLSGTKLEDLVDGDCFVFADEDAGGCVEGLLLVTDETAAGFTDLDYEHEHSNYIVAVRLSDGLIDYYPPSAKVHKVNATVVAAPK